MVSVSRLSHAHVRLRGAIVAGAVAEKFGGWARRQEFQLSSEPDSPVGQTVDNCIAFSHFEVTICGLRHDSARLLANGGRELAAEF